MKNNIAESAITKIGYMQVHSVRKKVTRKGINENKFNMNLNKN